MIIFNTYRYVYGVQMKDKRKTEFYMQKWNAMNKRNIVWELTFDQWWYIWEASGMYDKRGRARGQYQMCRFKDEGPYAVGNVRITTSCDNLQERKGRVEQGRLDRWARPGAKEDHSKLMREVVKTEAYKQAMLNRSAGDWYKNNRQKNAEAIRAARAKPVLCTNLKTNKSLTLVGEKEIKRAGFNTACVSKCANGKAKQHKGHTFTFI